jgi:hypothetical protein
MLISSFGIVRTIISLVAVKTDEPSRHVKELYWRRAGVTLASLLYQDATGFSSSVSTSLSVDGVGKGFRAIVWNSSQTLRLTARSLEELCMLPSWR